MATQTHARPIHLAWEEKNRKIVVTPKDEDRYALNVDSAIEFCRYGARRDKFSSMFKLLLNKLGEWTEYHLSDIETAYVTLGDGGLLFLVIQNKPSYNSRLQDELTDLDIEIANNPIFKEIQLSVLCLPSAEPETISSFFHPEMLLKFKNA